ncbi:MAG: hypothetical protein B1H08_01960 [Candidatus Omnitrophica bacterium 4484_171]|nr:MAG: hypothetical protein B1H08_01960 [Candidatus Omnitrophica bacterium 4484_171]
MNEGIIEERAQFDFIRYSNCWEDADILLRALRVKEGGIYLSIASAGDNSFSLLANNPSKVIAIDINSVQLACVELRKIAFQNLSYEELLKFLGVNKSTDRESVYTKIKHNLSSEAQEFWNAHPDFINKGIIHIGKFENYFRLFRNRILPLVHNKSTVGELLNARTKDERLEFYAKKWNTFRWKLLFKIFFSRKVMGRLGRDPEFFKYVETDVASRIFKRAEHALTILPTDKNPYLEYILTGNFQRALPFYLRPENFDSIRRNLNKLVIFKGDLRQAFKSYGTTKFDGFNLSDIFEYMSYQQYLEELKHVIGASKKGTRIVYWNMLADRKYVEELKDKIEFLDETASQLHREDKAFFYKSLIIGEVK